MNRPLAVILLAITLDAAGIGLIFPILPALLRELTAASEVSVLYGILLALYAFMQFIFAPVLGVLSDRFGRRPVLLVSMAGAAIDYLVMALSPYLWVVIAGRAIAGLTAANLSVATAYLADISAPDQRAARFGYLHACFGIGFIIGPLIGGVLGEWWVRAPFLAAAVLNLGNFLLALLVLPESRPGRRDAFDWAALNPLRPLGWAFAFKAILPLIAVYFVINLVGQTYGTVWVLFGEDRFGWSEFMVGLSLAGYGLFHAGAQATLVAPANRVLGAWRTLVLGLVAEVVALTALAFATDGWVAFALLPVFAIAGIGLPALQSLLSVAVDDDRQGQLQGVLTSLVSVTAIVGPLGFSAVYFGLKPDLIGLVWLVGVGIYALSVPIILMGRRMALSGV